MDNNELFKIDYVDYREETLQVACNGQLEYGSAGCGSAKIVYETVIHWMSENEGKVVSRLVMDFSKVDYEWGDGPLSVIVYPLLKKKIMQYEIISNIKNEDALNSLVKALSPHMGETIIVRGASRLQ